MNCAQASRVVATLALAVFMQACGWTRHELSPRAQAVKISKNEPGDECRMVGTFYTWDDCHRGGSVIGGTKDEAQLECIRWKADTENANYDVLEVMVSESFYKGRLYACPEPAGMPQWSQPQR